ncbi:MAG: tetratricopeptide repeat protein [Clostridium sp.]
MLKKIVKEYNIFKLKLTQKVSGFEEGMLDELEFSGEYVIKSKIEYVKKILKLIDGEIQGCEKDEIEKLDFLRQAKIDYRKEMAFLAANNMKNLEFCLNLVLEGDSFRDCLLGLKEVKEGNLYKGKVYFDKYFNEQKYMINHYYINKVYGQLLFDYEEFERASLFFRKAIEARPEDIEAHRKLVEIYELTGEKELLDRENEIISILVGDIECYLRKRMETHHQ